MAGTPGTWTEERKPEVEAALRGAFTRADAARALGVSPSSLDHACLVYGLAPQALLRRRGSAPPPSPGAVSSAPETKPEVEEPAPPPLDWTGARPRSTGSGLVRRLVFSDPHVPFHSVRACAAVIALAKSIQPHAVECLGDLWQMGAVSHHPRPFGGPENDRGALLQGVSFLEAIARAVPGAERRYYLGNHCGWADEFEDAHPEFAGLMAAKWLGLDRLGWEIVPRSAQPRVFGPLDFAHGTGGGEHYAKRYALHADTTARVHIRGHHHSMQHFRAKNGHEAWGAGWLGRPECSAFDYAKEKGHWEIGCLVVDTIGERVTVTPVHLDGGAALFGGRLIAA